MKMINAPMDRHGNTLPIVQLDFMAGEAFWAYPGDEGVILGERAVDTPVCISATAPVSIGLGYGAQVYIPATCPIYLILKAGMQVRAKTLTDFDAVVSVIPLL